ncbi:MAG TPA: DUF1080 domain-containing protein [Vicinamibacterales bacterium]|nr:DUF1080 domain-containing protein [Vicinamibacterales bacterium]
MIGLQFAGRAAALVALMTAITGWQSRPASSAKPPKGFTALYNGYDLSGWRGGDTFDHRKLLAMSEADRSAQIAKWNETMRAHWTANGAELVNDGQGAYATTEREYGDFELLVDYRTVAKADSGIYLRGVPQVQIWDYTEEAKFNLGANKGSGGLWNNSVGAPGKDPRVRADKPFGEWNTLRIVMVGSRVSVWLNDVSVVDHAIMENYYDRNTPVPARGPIQLQTHGGEIRWRNIFIREIASEEANTILRSKGREGFNDIFNGRNFDGWAGPLENYEVRDRSIVCKPERGGTIYWNQPLADFDVRLEFKLPVGGNNGLAIRYPGEGDTAYVGMTELQVLDDNYEKVRGPIDAKQAHGSAYGMVAAARGYQRPIGEWNVQDVSVAGSTVRVELNGTVILNTDLSKVDPATYMAKHEHPGVSRSSGFFGFAGHNDPVMFRNVQVRKR